MKENLTFEIFYSTPHFLLINDSFNPFKASTSVTSQSQELDKNISSIKLARTTSTVKQFPSLFLASLLHVKYAAI